MNPIPGSDEAAEKVILTLAKRIKDNGDLLRNALGQSWADTAIDEIRRDAAEIQRLIERICREQNLH